MEPKNLFSRLLKKKLTCFIKNYIVKKNNVRMFESLKNIQFPCYSFHVALFPNFRFLQNLHRDLKNFIITNFPI